MTHEQQPKPNILQILVRYWVLIVVVFVTISAWVTLSNKVDSHTDDIKSLKASDIATTAINNQILVELAKIQSDLSWLKQNIK